MDQGRDPVTGRPANPPIDTTQTSTDPEAIADDIRETRAEMDETIDALSAKLDPSRLVDQAKEAFTSSAKDAGTSMMESFKDSSFLDTIKDNPIPAAAVGLSVAWFLSKMGEAESDRYRADQYHATGDPYFAPRSRRPRSYGDNYGTDRTMPSRYDAQYATGGAGDGGESMKDKASDALGAAKDKAAGAVDAIEDKASGLVDSAKDALSGGADATRDRARQTGQDLQRYERQAESWMERQMQSNPLAVGAVALAAGALVGLSVPETNAEHQAFGDQADQVKDRLASVAADEAGKVKDAAQSVVDEAADKAKKVADEATKKGQKVADDATSRAEDVAGEAEDKAKKAANDAANKLDSSSSKSS